MATTIKMKQNSTMAVKIRGMLDGYTLKERIRELQQTFDMKQRNCEQRQANDRELLHAQEQVSWTQNLA
jgi:hypothetical protein